MVPHSQIHKYPRTPHLEGSRLQAGDEDLEQVPFGAIADCHLVIEEKMDGANAAVSFTPDGGLLLQSRGHYLTGGGRERHFDLFKRWAAAHRDALWNCLGPHHVMYGEWLYAKHTVFYDALPHYFLEFDVLDTRTGVFLDTERRRKLLENAAVIPVKVLACGSFAGVKEITRHLGPSGFITPGAGEALLRACETAGTDFERARAETDPTALMEGLYLKVEEQGRVVRRLKYVRASFLANVVQSGSHWLNRAIIPNQLAPGVDIFEGKP